MNRPLAEMRAAADAGNLVRALELGEAAVKRQPRSFEALFLTAVTLQRMGRLRDAVAYYRRAIRAHGTAAEAHHNLGCLLLSLGELDNAIPVLERALALRPDAAETLDALGFAHAESGRLPEALALLERAIERNGDNASTFCRLGNVLLRLHRFAEAEAVFTQALQQAPDSAELLDGLGVALDRLERTAEAAAVYRRALELDPANANAACNLGKVLLEIGDVDEAMTWFDRAIELEPRNGSFYLPLMTGGSKSVKPEHRDAMLRLGAQIDTLPHAQQIDLHFALANVAERDGRIDDAFAHLVAGNRLKRADIPYDEAAALAYVRSTQAAFSNPLMDALRGCGDPSERPIFIVGMPRSGSTLVEQVLAAHPAVVGGGEFSVLGDLVRTMWPAIRATTIEELRAQVRGIGEAYLGATDALAGGAPRLADKTLEHVQLVPLIHVILPNARIIHIQRDDLDACFSCFATFFSDHKVPFSYDLREIGHYYRGYLDMVDVWRAFVPADRFLDVRYEALVADFEAQARRIIAFCGLDWDAACLNFHQARRLVRTASNLQVRQPLYRSSIGRAQPFLAHLAPMIEALQPRAAES
jgi:tetratricopeptide (TPR) repeat protein